MIVVVLFGIITALSVEECIENNANHSNITDWLSSLGIGTPTELKALRHFMGSKFMYQGKTSAGRQFLVTQISQEPQPLTQAISTETLRFILSYIEWAFSETSNLYSFSCFFKDEYWAILTLTEGKTKIALKSVLSVASLHKRLTFYVAALDHLQWLISKGFEFRHFALSHFLLLNGDFASPMLVAFHSLRNVLEKEGVQVYSFYFMFLDIVDQENFMRAQRKKTYQVGEEKVYEQFLQWMEESQKPEIFGDVMLEDLKPKLINFKSLLEEEIQKSVKRRKTRLTTSDAYKHSAVFSKVPYINS